MAKLNDKLYNRTIVGKLELEDGDEIKVSSLDISGDGSFGGNVKGKTLSQSQPNFVLSAEDFLITAPEGIEITKGYCAIEVINGVFYIVLNFSFENNTENSISVGNLSNITIKNIPEVYGSKIYTIAGHNLTELTASIEGITGGRMAHDNGIPATGFYTTLNVAISKTPGSNNQNKMTIIPRDVPAVASGSKVSYTFRTFLLLI